MIAYIDGRQLVTMRDKVFYYNITDEVATNHSNKVQFIFLSSWFSVTN